jgi:hypothetical protein
VSGRSYASGRLGGGRVVDCGWGISQGISAGNVVRHAPPLHVLYNLCNDMYNFLEQDSKNVCIVHCMVGILKNILINTFPGICYSKACPQVMGGGDGLWVLWKVAANILSTKSWIADEA